MNTQKLTVIILTFNSERSLGQVVSSCLPLGARILVVDSFSTDHTVDIASRLGCEVVRHEFENYAAQRNWAQDKADIHAGSWVLHLDSDEVLSPLLRESIAAAGNSDSGSPDGYLVRRLSYFWGRPLRYGHMNPSWHLRLFRAGAGFCENRLYDQHFVLSCGKAARLSGILHDLQLVSLERWTASHNRWSTAEAIEVMRNQAGHNGGGDTLKPSLTGDQRMRKRWLKNHVWYAMPLLLRPFIFFGYSYILKLGFLDGKPGLVYHVLQAFWFRFLIDAKIAEAQMEERTSRTPAKT